MTTVIAVSMGFGGVLGFALGFLVAYALNSPDHD